MDIKIEIVNFYPGASLGFGSVHIRLPEIGIELRGLPIFKVKDQIIVRLPSRNSPTDKKKNGKPLQYTHFSFIDQVKQQMFFQTLAPMVKKYIMENFEEYFKSYKNPEKKKFKKNYDSRKPYPKPRFDSAPKPARPSFTEPAKHTEEITPQEIVPKARFASKFEKPRDNNNSQQKFTTTLHKKSTHPLNFSTPPARKK